MINFVNGYSTDSAAEEGSSKKLSTIVVRKPSSMVQLKTNSAKATVNAYSIFNKIKVDPNSISSSAGETIN